MRWEKIIKQFRTYSDSLAIRYQKRARREEKTEAIQRTVQYMLQNYTSIESSKQVSHQVVQLTG